MILILYIPNFKIIDCLKKYYKLIVPYLITTNLSKKVFLILLLDNKCVSVIIKALAAMFIFAGILNTRQYLFCCVKCGLYVSKINKYSLFFK